MDMVLQRLARQAPRDLRHSEPVVTLWLDCLEMLVGAPVAVLDTVVAAPVLGLSTLPTVPPELRAWKLPTLRFGAYFPRDLETILSKAVPGLTKQRREQLARQAQGDARQALQLARVPVAGSADQHALPFAQVQAWLAPKSGPRTGYDDVTSYTLDVLHTNYLRLDLEVEATALLADALLEDCAARGTLWAEGAPPSLFARACANAARSRPYRGQLQPPPPFTPTPRGGRKAFYKALFPDFTDEQWDAGW